MKHLKKNKSQSNEEVEAINFIDVIMNKEVAEIIRHCIDNHIFYGIFPVVGDSMTCNDGRSIPDGSGVLVFDLQMDMRKSLLELAEDIPINKPITICLANEYGQCAFFVKTISFIDTLHNRVKLSSYNPKPEYRSAWVSIHKVRSIYKVIQVIKKERLEATIENDW